ncbi:dihydroorotase family protein [Patescibacteria group bacterium]|nr:dihydroorotase family protein [Patescibacteria group bacterium]
MKKRLVKNARIVTPEKVFLGNVVIDEKGKIEKITQEKAAGFKGEVIDAKGRYLMPGLVEVHGHLREPGFEDREDVPHGTSAAAAGGFTSILDMPNTKPPTVTVSLLKDKINKIYPKRSFIDYAFFMGVSSDKLDELKKVSAKDIVGVKVFMAGHETVPTTIPDDLTLNKVMDICSKRKILLAVHAEDQWLINYYNREFKKTGRSDAALWSEIRPTTVVASAAARAIALASGYKGFRLYILHMSTPEEFALVAAAKTRGQTVYGELVGYQLSFNTDDYKKYGNKIKVAPAVRSPENQQAVWQLFHDGRIDVLCSEHTPHPRETKSQPDVWKAQSGTPDIQEAMPAAITGWLKKFGKNTLEEGLRRIAIHSSKRPAEIFNLKGKGEIRVGNDADFSIIDTKNHWTVKKEDLFSKCGWSAFEGMKLLGRPIMTFVRGELVYNNGKIVSRANGKWINH